MSWLWVNHVVYVVCDITNSSTEINSPDSIFVPKRIVRGQVFPLERIVRGQVFPLERIVRGQVFPLERIVRGQVFPLASTYDRYWPLSRGLPDRLFLSVSLPALWSGKFNDVIPRLCRGGSTSLDLSGRNLFDFGKQSRRQASKKNKHP